MKQLQIGVPNFPDIFVCRNKEDIALAKQHGLPYLVWESDDYDKLVKLVLYHLVCKLFPEIDWATAWNLTPHDLEWCEDGNIICYDGSDTGEIHEFNINDYLVTKRAKVNIEQLEALHLLPKFIGDIIDCIRVNITDYTWHDGLNKKTGIWMGNYIPQDEVRNLIILDVSYSIPVGISSVMLKLIDTLRHQCEADLIVTGRTSYFWSIEEELPTPQEIRDKVPRSNESEMFCNILKNNIAGKHWGHIISFGDDDTPYWGDIILAMNNMARKPDWWIDSYKYTYQEFKDAMQGTEIDMVHHYHTHSRNTRTGYAKWTAEFKPKEVFDTSWCSIMDKGYR